MKGLHTVRADLEALRLAAEEFGIDKICLMATYFPLKHSGLHNEELIRRIGDDPLFSCFGSLNMEAEDLSEGIRELEDFADKGLISGIKLYPGYQNILLSEKYFDRVYEIAQAFDLPVACHMGELHHCCPRGAENHRCGKSNCPLDERGDLAHPRKIADAAARFPKVKFVASHLANPYFRELRVAMRRYPNIYTDISGQFISGSDEDTPEYREFLIGEIKDFLLIDGGIDRVMFATDFPIQSYADSLKLVKDLGLNERDEEKILSGNALKIIPKR